MRESIQARLENEIRDFFHKAEGVQVPGKLSANLAKRLADLFVFNDDEDEEWYDILSMRGNLLLRTHTENRCQGQVCCVHNPTDHHMVSWEQEWSPRQEMMYRICDHEMIHPDPDDLQVRNLMGMVSHPCDGCCNPETWALDTLGTIHK